MMKGKHVSRWENIFMGRSRRQAANLFVSPENITWGKGGDRIIGTCISAKISRSIGGRKGIQKTYVSLAA